jgi:hypothetical protein
MGKKANQPTSTEEAIQEKEIVDGLQSLINRAHRENEILNRIIQHLQSTTETNMEDTHVAAELEDETTAAPAIPEDKDTGDAPNDIRISSIEELIIREAGPEVLKLVNSHAGTNPFTTFVTSTTTRFNIEKLSDQIYHNIINLKKVNDIRRINKFFETVNSKLPMGGTYIDSVETYINRKERILKKSRV